MGRYGGKLLELEGDAPWAMGPRQKLHDRVLGAVLCVGQYLEVDGQNDPALALYHRALTLDETSEALCRRLMDCYLRMGRRAEAARVHDRCRNALRVSPA
jgi:two-component SAPR family response regulator